MLCHLLTKLELTASASMAQRLTDDCVSQWVNNYKYALHDFKECHPRCVGELDRWEGSQKHNLYLI